jgi:2-keto-3-deoxy-L-rhamnonate aldolase RhmA
MAPSFRSRLRAGELLIGPLMTLASPEAAEIMAYAGFDWLFIDAEHGPLDALTIQRMMQGAGAVPCVVRVAASAEVPIKQALDIGAAGIIAPMVNTAEQAANVVRWAKYSPQGTRGIGVGRAHGYGAQYQEYLRSANEDIAVIVQAEHIDAVKNIEAIVQVPGLDAVLVGPNDLAASLGRIGELTHPDLIAAIERVTQVCRSARMPLGIFGASAEAVRPHIERGYTLITVGVDVVMLGEAAKQLLARLR